MATPVSPEPITSSPAPAPGTVSPPSYTPKPAEVAPNTDEKIAIPAQKIDDDNLPEVVVNEPDHSQDPQPVHTHTPDPPKSEYPVPPSTVSPAPGSIMNLHGDGTQSPPILQHPALAGQMAPGQMAPGQMGYAGHESMVVPMSAPTPAPVYPPGAQTVTPLNLLTDQSDSVDCPFCQRRTETKVKKEASGMTHGIAAGLFFTTLFGVIFPYTCHCAPHISHYCKNCGRKVAYKQRGGQMEPQGTPEHLREVSKYPAAEPKTKK
ncbi:hypothetical protein NW759_007892 [Fusarium solani]|nr:hypothetical protein NW759_007892 [Fusarium solani]